MPFAVISLYAKSGGKNGRHCDTSSVDRIAGASYIGTQVFEHLRHRLFTPIPNDFAYLMVKEFAHLSSLQFLVLLCGANKSFNSDVEISPEDLKILQALQRSKLAIEKCITLQNKRRKGEAEDGEESSGGE